MNDKLRSKAVIYSNKKETIIYVGRIKTFWFNLTNWVKHFSKKHL